VDQTGIVVDKEACSNHQMFKDNDVLIYENKDFFVKHFATYPVIYADFKTASGNSFKEVLDSFRTMVHLVFEQHKYSLKSDKLDSDEKEVFKIFCRW
jgi:hypothetical protein